MEYDPAVSTHKASSITSTTSTSSSGTWDIPTPSNTFIHSTDNIKPDEDYSYHTLADERISLLDYQPYHYESNRNTFTSFMDTFGTDNSHDLIPITKMNDKNHKKDNMITPAPIYLQHSDQVTVPAFTTKPRSILQDGYQPIRPSPVAQRPLSTPPPPPPAPSSVTSSSSSSKRSKINRDLLTDDEKRMNHIASEQKRRNTIRMGFKDLTDMIPTLKNINNSKSTILFKAVEYMKHLDRRNRGLREKIASLQVRMSVQGRMDSHQRSLRSSNSQRYRQVFGHKQQQENAPSDLNHLPAHTLTALIAHKNQQRQLQELQDQLRAQQELLAKHNISSPDIILPTIHKKASTTTTTTTEQHHYHSISIPSSTSSNSDETELVDSYTQHSPKKRPWHNL